MLDTILAYFWIGASDLASEGSWIWVQTGEPVNFWERYEPNGATDENCAIIYNSMVYDVGCSTLCASICQVF